MRKLIKINIIGCILTALVYFLALSAAAEDFLGAPLFPQGEKVSEGDTRLEMKLPISHDEALGFYRNALKDEKDIKYRDWKEDTYIEDDGNREWHSITISKNDREGTRVVILKDNWTWILGTLILRYIGVFVVLMILLFAMSISGKIISSIVAKTEAKKAAG
jgi:hypothetical protein